jgi:DNA-binding GntR family transcriptional regulator
MIDADMQFHHMIYAAAGNPLIAETANHHWRHIRRAMGAVLQIVGVRYAVWDEHTAIVQAINDGDADLAERLARQHCEHAGQHIAAQLTQHVRTRPECLTWAGGASMQAPSAQAISRAPAVSHGERLSLTAQCE